MAASKLEEYLVTNVLNEGCPITYRQLSRTFKVHANHAKELLFDFYQTQNSRKLDSVHATYMVYGIRKPQKLVHQPNGSNAKEDGDAAMHDDTLGVSSSLPENHDQDHPPLSTTTFTLANQERLQHVKSLYDKVYSVHIYSLEPGPLSNIYILSDCSLALASSTSDEDPLENWKQYGTIRNQHVKRRGNRPPAITSSAAQPSTAGMKPSNPTKSSSVQKSEKPPSSTAETSSSTEAQPKNTMQQKSRPNIFSSFAKASQTSTSSKSKKIDEDEPMKDAPLESDAEEAGSEPEDLSSLNNAAANLKSEEARKAKLEREAELRKMMEADDSEPESNKDVAAQQSHSAAESPAANSDDPPDNDETENMQVDTASPLDEQQDERSESQPHVTTVNGRRRGRRRVMKKKTTKDAEGYLVTKEEPVWESFSEDEAETTSKGKPSSSIDSNSTSSKPKKTSSSAKPGQGNIMNFFGKK